MSPQPAALPASTQPPGSGPAPWSIQVPFVGDCGIPFPHVFPTCPSSCSGPDPASPGRGCGARPLQGSGQAPGSRPASAGEEDGSPACPRGPRGPRPWRPRPLETPPLTAPRPHPRRPRPWAGGGGGRSSSSRSSRSGRPHVGPAGRPASLVPPAVRGLPRRGDPRPQRLLPRRPGLLRHPPPAPARPPVSAAAAQAARHRPRLARRAGPGGAAAGAGSSPRSLGQEEEKGGPGGLGRGEHREPRFWRG